MKTISMALLCIFITGCAASNGGGHVVGNGMMPEGMSRESVPNCDCSVPNQPFDCGCGNPKPKKKANTSR